MEKQDIEPIKIVGKVPVPQQYQLPKATLTKEQRLRLLEERFLRAEVNEETYKELKAEIEKGFTLILL